MTEIRADGVYGDEIKTCMHCGDKLSQRPTMQTETCSVFCDKTCRDVHTNPDASCRVRVNVPDLHRCPSPITDTANGLCEKHATERECLLARWAS